MELYVGRGKQAFLVGASILLLASQVPSCSSSDKPSESPATGGDETGGSGAGPASGGLAATGGSVAAGGARGGVGTGGAANAGGGAGGTSIGGTPTGGVSSAGAAPGGAAPGGAPTGGVPTGGAPTGGAVPGGAPTGGVATGGASTGGVSSGATVALAQSSMVEATQITEEEVRSLVTEAVALAGGLDFIENGQAVILKPNLLKTRMGSGMFAEDLVQEANGVTTDYRIVKVVAELVRAQNPDGRVVVLEGSVEDTGDAFVRMGYTQENFGSLVDEFVPLEGDDCTGRTTTGLVQAQSANGVTYWVSQEVLDADVLITVPTLKTHWQAGMTGGVKNIGIGLTPVSQYPNGNTADDCSRSLSIINHDDPDELSQWIAEFYSVRPADFVVVDALQGVQHGPSPDYVPGGDYPNDLMNRRLVIASRDPVAADVIGTQVMQCDVGSIRYLTLLGGWGIGTADPAEIQVVGVPVAQVATHFSGPSFACP